jgi:hypothetical protein
VVRVFVGIIGGALVLLMLAEFFSTFLLPRRVKRDPRIARGLFRTFWRPWRWLAGRYFSPSAGDTLLGLAGPLGLLTILALLSAGVIVGFSCLHWAFSSHVATARPSNFGRDFYFSGGTFFSTSTPPGPPHVAGKVLQVIEAALGFGFLAIAIGYLPALFQAFSRRETSVSRLDPRAGSPPTAGVLLERSSQRGGWRELNDYLAEWESWTAELMETHLSYPILGYFRSQHLSQNWLAALTTVVDSCAYAVAYGPYEESEPAELTFRVGRHALADLAFVFDPRGTRRARPDRERLSEESLRRLRATLENSGLHSEESAEAAQRLAELRSSYEPYALVLSNQLRLALPDWLPPGDVSEYWRLATRPDRRRQID